MKPILKPKLKPPNLHLVETPQRNDGGLSFDSQYESILVPESKAFSLNTLMKRATRIQEKCTDYVVRNSAANIEVIDGLRVNTIYDDKSNVFNFTEHSLGQICNRLEIPFSYIKRCHLEGKTDLAIENLNAWIKHTDKDYLVRTYNGRQIRGLLSTRYTPFDTPDILKVVDDLVDQGEYKIKGFTLNPERFHLRLVGEKLDIPNEDIFAGIQIDSSDVGRSRLFVRFFIYKQVCTNGLMRTLDSDYLFVQRHMGITTEIFAQEFSDALKRLPEIAAEAIEQVRLATKKSIKLEPENISEEAMSNLRNVTGLSEDIINKAAVLMHQNYKPTVWGLINGVTEVAKGLTLEKRLEVERRAGLLLTA